MLKPAVAVLDCVSAACTMNEKIPLPVGVPQSAPVPLRTNPGGKLPWVMLQLYGGAPPVAVNCAL
jgi:hypothetical protein